MPKEPAETVIFAFADKPVRIIWISRDGVKQAEEILIFGEKVQ